MIRDSPTLRCLRATPDQVESLLALVTDEDLLWKPSPERWSICEVLRHLDDVERANLGVRVRRLVEEDLPRLEDYDPASRYRAGAYPNDDGRSAFASFHEARRETIEWLARRDPSAWTRRGLHPEVGEIDLGQLLNLWAFHDLSHLRQIAELVKARAFWDGIGSLRTYYRVDP